jgi:molecular chaperone DnaJ
VTGRKGSQAMAEAGDHYGVLGVDRSASTSEIKAAYRRLALKWHPDRNPGDRRAEERFKEVSMAYAVLGDEDKRARYDRFGQAADVAFGVGGDFDSATDFFDAIFGDLFGLGRKRAAGQDLRYTLELEFSEAAMGCEQNIRFTRQEDCGSCSGTGAETGAAGLVTCNKCAGKGYTRQRTGFFSARRECLACGGAGEVPRVRCPTCGGVGLVEREKDYVVRVPPGSVAGSVQRVAGEGSPGRRGGPAGDLFVNVRVRPHAFYREEGGVLVCDLPVSPSEASLGAEVDVSLLDTSVKMKVPAGTQSGALFRLRGKGLPRPGGLPRGDAHVRVTVETPSALTDEARALLSRLEAVLPAAALPRRQAFRRLVPPAASDAGNTVPRGAGRAQKGGP